MIGYFARALNCTHKYLQAMGARVAPAKSFNFTNRQKAKVWLERTRWEHIKTKIEVVEDFRYLGAHLTTGSKARRPAIDAG